MRYKGEAYISGKLVGSAVMIATHPSQVARRMTQEIKRKFPNAPMFILYVANEKGELWIHSVKKINSVYNIKSLSVNVPTLNTDEIDMVFSMNRTLKQLLR